MNVAILAVQGAFIEHAHMLEKLNQEYVLIRKKSDLPERIDALILPGGESTTQRKLLLELDLLEKLKQSILEGVPVLGTCAGLILLAEEIGTGEPEVFGTLPVKVVRNAYGRQLGSFSTEGNFGEIEHFPMRFIRAPYIEKIFRPEVEILSVTDGKITAVRYQNQFGVAFHPELTEDLRIHQEFLHC